MSMQVKKRILMTIGILATVNLVLLGAGAVPAALSIAKYKEKITEARGQLDAQYALLLYMRTIATTRKETTGRLATLHAVALEEGRELGFITALEQVAESAGVDQRISLETANQKDISAWEREIPLKLDFSGTYPQVLRYLNAVERLPYLITVGAITVEGLRENAEANPEGRVQGSASATVYWQAKAAPAFVRGEDLADGAQ